MSGRAKATLALGALLLVAASHGAASGAFARSAAARSAPAGVTGAAMAASMAAPSSASSADASSTRRSSAQGWIDVGYGALVDRRRLSHSGESVGSLLEGLAGRPVPPPGERLDDLTSHVLLDPLLEPYAFVLADAIDAQAPPSSAAYFEIGQIWPQGGTEPAYVELLRARRYLLESDGAGHLRLFAPWTPVAGKSAAGEGTEARTSEAAAREAWNAAWSVVRHALAAERRRLAADRNPAGGTSAAAELPALDVTIYPYRAFPAETRFALGTVPIVEHVTDTRGKGPAGPIDLASWQRFLERGQLFEGGRIDRDGSIRLFGSDAPAKPLFLGRPLTLADFAVAYRAVVHGGLGEPYMSLDRGAAPHTSLVNYGGRLQDTSLGLVSLRCDIRFKTFSLGIDILSGADLRSEIRSELPSFRTHTERFAADPRSQTVLAQQTRLWFYPDSVDLTLSKQADVLVLRRPRMSAASERVDVQAGQEQAPDPPWTAETVGAINHDYDTLAKRFSELGDLDQVVRMLSFFTWLRQAASRGIVNADMDVLLALEIPAEPTPRNFPQLLAFNALPPPSGGGEAQARVFNRVPVGEALERLQPRSGLAIPARRRFQRALAGLDRRQGDHAALAKELGAYDPKTLDETTLDLLSYRAERLRMHQLVLGTLPAADRAAIDQLTARTPGLRTLSVGIGGLDLGMSQALARASSANEGSTTGATSGEDDAAAGGARRPTGPPVPWPDPDLLPKTVSPIDPKARSAAGVAGVGNGAWSASGVWKSGAEETQWWQVVAGADGPDPRSRRTIVPAKKEKPRRFERLEEGRYLRYRMAPSASGLEATAVTDQFPEVVTMITRGPSDAAGGASPASEIPADLVTLALESSTDDGSGPGAADEAPMVPLVVRGAGGRELKAPFPRPLLQRVVLGREADLTPERPLSGLDPASKVLGPAQHLMVMMDSAANGSPWDGPIAIRPGEEEAATLAGALGRWWRAEPQAGAPTPATSVGTEGARSIARWTATSVPGTSVLLLPEGGFPGAASALREAVQAAWRGGEVVTGAPKGAGPGLVVLVSAESPARLGSRLRELARSQAMKGKLLAVWPLGGPVRPDLPRALLAEGNLAALGIADYSPLDPTRAPSELRALSDALAAAKGRTIKPEDLAGPLVWYY